MLKFRSTTCVEKSLVLLSCFADRLRGNGGSVKGGFTVRRVRVNRMVRFLPGCSAFAAVQGLSSVERLGSNPSDALRNRGVRVGFGNVCMNSALPTIADTAYPGCPAMRVWRSYRNPTAVYSFVHSRISGSCAPAQVGEWGCLQNRSQF